MNRLLTIIRADPAALLAPLIIMLVAANGCQFSRRIYLSDDLTRADALFDMHQYELAAVKYSQLIRRYPDSAARQRVYMQKGLCFHNERIQSLKDAASVYLEYLEEYPDGVYREEANKRLERIRIIQTDQTRESNKRETTRMGDIVTARQVLERDPYNAELHLHLGNLLWEAGEYESAANEYARAQEIDAALQEHAMITRRLTVDANGQLAPLTPELAAAREREANPLVVFDVNDYKSRPPVSRAGVRESFYNVLGKVRNQSARTIQAVEVDILFVNAAGELLDAQTSLVGAMPPGSVRVFRARSTRFDDIHNVRNVDIVARDGSPSMFGL